MISDICTILRYQDIGQNEKRSLTFCTWVKFSRWSDFYENRRKQDMTVPFARARAKLGGSIR